MISISGQHNGMGCLEDERGRERDRQIEEKVREEKARGQSEMREQ